MARKKKRIVKRHNKFFKYLTIVGASLGVISSASFVAFMTIDALNDNFITDKVREYTATFISDGTVVQSDTYKRGEEIVVPIPPDHEMDGEYMYVPVGWDLTGNGIPELFPNNPMRMYFSFTANAVYFKMGLFDPSKFDLANMDLESLLDLMDKLNLDYEQLMDMFGLTPEDLMNMFGDMPPVLTFEANASPYIAYFRSSSLGDFNYSSKQFRQPDVYDADLISPGSINPLSYTANLLEDIYNFAPERLDPNFDFVDYDITFGASRDYYAVPDCELSNSMDGEIVDSDAHYLKTPKDNSYQTRAAYVPAMDDVISLMQMLSSIRSNPAVKKDERAYRKYAKSKYTSIPEEYEEIIDGLIEEHHWEPNDLSQTNNIAATISSLGGLSMIQDGEINLNYKKNTDPVKGLIENESGSDFDFNTVAVMVFRRLGIPARMVKGYVVPNVQQGHNEVTMLNQHYWCEIYVEGVGWMICECMNTKEIFGTNIYGDLDTQSNPVKDNKVLDHIEVTPPRQLQYNPGENLNLNGMSVHAYFTDGTDNDVPLYDCKFNRKAPTAFGEHDVEVSYTVKNTTKTDSFKIEVGDFEVKVKSIEFNTERVRKNFYIGEDFDYSQAYAIVTLENNTTEILYAEDLDVDTSQVNWEKAGTYTVILSASYHGTDQEIKYEITIFDTPVEEVIIESLPNDLEYYQREKFDSTGLVVKYRYAGKEELVDADYGTYDILGATKKDLLEIGTHEVTIKHTRLFDGTDRTASFNITVYQNDMNGIEVTGYKDNYVIGDYFDSAAFLKNIKLYATYEFTPKEELAQEEASKVEIDSRPNLSSVGVTHATVSYTDDYYGKFTQILDISVAPVTAKDFALSSKVSFAGPGPDMDPTNMFKITTSYQGTMYLRSATYTNYNPSTGWSGVISNVSSALTYDKAKQVYDEESVSVEYLTDMTRSLIPIYSNTYSQSSRTSGQTDNYTFTMFELNNENYQRLSYYVNFSSSSMSNNYNTQYNSAYQTGGQYLSVTASTSAQNAINMFINSKGYGTMETLEKVLAVKNDLQNDFSYNISFSSYDASEDPIYSFLNTHEGICNNFATTAVMIYRRLGIPARYVTGFGIYSAGGETVVNTNKAHAWVEVWLDNVGWVTVDPTGYDDGHTNDGSATGNYYGQGFGGDTTNGIYNIDNKTYSGEVKLKYTYDNSVFIDDDGDYVVYYDGYSGHYHNVYCEITNYNELPSHLEFQINYVKNTSSLYPEDDGVTLDYFNYVPELKIYDRFTGEDVTLKHNYEITDGKDGVFYYVDPRPISVTLRPQNSIYYISSPYVHINLIVTSGSLVNNHTIYFEPTNEIDYSGYPTGPYDNYFDFGDIVIRDYYGNDVTEYYFIEYTLVSVEIQP